MVRRKSCRGLNMCVLPKLTCWAFIDKVTVPIHKGGAFMNEMSPLCMSILQAKELPPWEIHLCSLQKNHPSWDFWPFTFTSIYTYIYHFFPYLHHGGAGRVTRPSPEYPMLSITCAVPPCHNCTWPQGRATVFRSEKTRGKGFIYAALGKPLPMGGVLPRVI